MDKISGISEKIVIGVIVLILIGGGLWRGLPVKSTLAPVNLPEPEIRSDSEPDEPELIIVYLTGAVSRPGIYHLEEGSRIYELIEKAGGFSEEADGEAMNLARPLVDGEQIHVVRIGETPAAGPAGEVSGGKININQAGESELTSLPGIGEVKARQIISHREKHGPFRDTRELMDVSGIGEKTYENIADLVTIY